ncbi:MAG: DUF3575 domain-containing protein [Chitinophagaceae bacterium]|nr:DUF3575 domain-containing protein [Chitinophagaceae bacterium]
MKKILALTVLLFSFVIVKAQSSKMNAVKINPLSALVATGNIAYERAVGAQTSVQLGVFYSGFKSSSLKYEGFGITPEFRYYISKENGPMNGVYVGPFARYQQFSIKDKSDGSSVKFSSVGGGALIGWEKAWKSGFVLDIFAGPSYNAGKFKDGQEEDLAFGFDGFSVRTGITIGFAF